MANCSMKGACKTLSLSFWRTSLYLKRRSQLLLLRLTATDLDRDGFETKIRGIKEAATSHAAMTSHG